MTDRDTDSVTLTVPQAADLLATTPHHDIDPLWDFKMDGPDRPAAPSHHKGYIRHFPHRLTVSLHPFGIASTHHPLGLAECACQHDHEWAWQTGRMPRLLPYADVADWIAEHYIWAGASEAVVTPLRAVRTLLALTENSP